ncbi:unnamed protein product, partial [Amoebophrya sp. A120]
PPFRHTASRRRRLAAAGHVKGHGSAASKHRRGADDDGQRCPSWRGYVESSGETSARGGPHLRGTCEQNQYGHRTALVKKRKPARCSFSKARRSRLGKTRGRASRARAARPIFSVSLHARGPGREAGPKKEAPAGAPGRAGQVGNFGRPRLVAGACFGGACLVLWLPPPRGASPLCAT